MITGLLSLALIENASHQENPGPLGSSNRLIPTRIISWPMDSTAAHSPLPIAKKIHTSERDENAFVARIRQTSKLFFEMLGSAESGRKTTPLEKAQKVGR